MSDFTTDKKAGHGEHYVRPFESEEIAFEELQDAAPSARFKLSVSGWIGAIIVSFWVFIGIFGPFLAPYHENDLPFPDDYSEYQAPKEGAFLGTDVEDRDVMSRIMYGAGRTIGIAFAGTVLAYFLGVVLGIGAAVAGPWVDMIVSRINDAFISLPTIMLGLVVVTAVGSSIPVLIVTAGLIYMTIVYRLARAIGMEIMVMDYVEAAKVRGEGIWWIVTKEIWPNAAMPLISDFGLRLIYVILFISSLSFLGMGVQPPQADWGLMVRENLGAFQTYGASLLPVVAPALAIATLTVGINLIVDDISAHAGGKLTKAM
ncbi:MAG: ABC transporter permease [Alphaproteobacteria bacterium]|jgi:peptide/nickel transport system permease protein|uniref:ABC transporter permease n=1 Tax=Pacificispira sp. TaxID=2888761 RepID=UPI001B16193E|nr:ABC transporter permease [Alphaproteobacteria bacterium]MEC9264580.1 ABC transporter permease [Pseudomonadota bacterium]